MKRRDFLKTIGIGAASLMMPGCAVGAGSKKKPNFVFIFIDDLVWKDVGFTGMIPGSGGPSRYYETPNIDKLADRGVIFTNAYSNAPTCRSEHRVKSL